jgi:intracellular proteinase inhibitor BsuPI
MRVTSKVVRRCHGALGVLLSCFLTMPAGRCAGDEGSVAKPELQTHLLLKNASGKESSEFQSGEAITFIVTIRNRVGVARVFSLPSSQTHDVLVYAGKDVEAWRWSSGRMFAQVITELTLSPGESRSFAITWNQTDNKGAPLSPGTYQAVGQVPAGVPGSRSDPVTFTIRPSAAKAPDR